MVPTQSETHRTRAPRRATLRHPWLARRRAEGEQGAVLVETALIMPLLILLVFGVIEFSLVYQSAAKISDTSRSVARTTAALGTDAGSVDAASNAAQAALSSLPKTATPVTMLIYKPNPQGLPGSATTMDPDAIVLGCLGAWGTCTMMHWDGEAATFVQTLFTLDPGAPPGTGTPVRWNVEVDEVCGPDYGTVGVVIFSSYEPVTGLFADLLRRDGRVALGPGVFNPDFNPLWDRAIFKFDPDLQAECT